MFCKECGNRLSAGSNYCAVCGTPVRDTVPNGKKSRKAPRSSSHPTNKNRWHKPVIAFIGLCWIVLVVITSLAIYDETQTQRYLKLLHAGSNYAEKQEWAEAIHAYEDARKIKSREPVPYLRLADIYLKANNAENARAILDEGYRKTKSDEIQAELDYFTLIRAADSAIIANDFGAAAQHLENAIGIKPNVAENYLLLATAYVEEWELYKASTILQQGYDVTSDKSLCDVSIWGPFSIAETGVFALNGMDMPPLRCIYRFYEDKIYSYAYGYNPFPMFGANYICENGQVKYVSLLDYDGYNINFGINPLQLPPVAALNYVITTFDLDYDANGTLASVSYDNKQLINIDYSSNTVKMTAVTDYGDILRNGDFVTFHYDDKKFLSGIETSNIYCNIKHSEDGGYEIISSYDDEIYNCKFNSDGLCIQLSVGGAVAFSRNTIEGKISEQLDGRGNETYKFEYVGGELTSTSFSDPGSAYDNSNPSLVLYYEYNNEQGTNRLVKITTAGESNDAFTITYNNDGSVCSISSKEQYQYYCYKDSKEIGYIEKSSYGDETPYSFEFHYDYAGRIDGVYNTMGN